MSSDEGMYDPSGDEEEDSAWSCTVTKQAGKKMEKCLVGKQEIMLPEVLTEQKYIFDEVLSIDTWKNVLTPAQRDHLMKFLPTFPDKAKDLSEKEETVRKLFGGENIKFGNPVHQFHTKLKGGFFSPDIAKYTGMIRNVKYREYEYRQQKYYGDLLRDMLLSRQKVLDQVKTLPQGERPKLEYKTVPENSKERTMEHRSKRKYARLLKEVRGECGVEDTSSEEEDFSSSALKNKKQLFKTLCPIPSPEPTIPSVIATYDIKPSLNGDVTSDEEKVSTVNKHHRPISPMDVTEEEYVLLLKNHRKKKQECDKMECPELDIHGISLEEIMTRCQATKKSPNPKPAVPSASMTLSKRKKLKMKERAEKKLKKDKDNRSETSSRFNFTDDDNKSGDSFYRTEGDNTSEYTMSEMYNKSNAFIGSQNNFFSLIRDLLIEFSDGKANTAKVEEKVRELQECSNWSTMAWTKLETNWVDTVTSALKFLAGELIGAVPDNFVPFLDYRERAQQWTWIGAGRDTDDKLAQLFKHWMTNKKLTGNDDEGRDGSPPPSRSKTTFVVRATSEEEKQKFRDQELRRFENPHKSFTYNLHGYESVVGPVKGVYTKESALNKAREHALLVSSRPSFVTILTLVRDASARLPNGEGTRGDICELLKDSQYLAPGVSDPQLNVVVSGALDRLHSEKDPCVKYDVNRKLWIYLHRSRTENEFELIHQAHGAAQKAKKSLSQTSKPKSSKTKLKDTISSVQQLSTSNPAIKMENHNSSHSSAGVQSPNVITQNPLLTQSPRASTPGSRTVAAALKNASASLAAQTTVNVTVPITTIAGVRPGQVTSSNILSSPQGATIRLQLQQYQLQQLQQQQKQIQQKLQQVAAAQQTSNAKSGASNAQTINSPQLKGEQILKSLPFNILQSLQASVADAASGGAQSIPLSLATAIRPLQRQASAGSPVPQQSPAGTPTPGSPVPSRLPAPATVTSTALSSLVQSSTAGAPLVAKLVQQAGGSQMVNVSNLLAAQRAQNLNQVNVAGNATLKIQGGKPIHLAGKPRGQLVQIKGQQPMGLLQGALPTISIIPQTGGAGVMTLDKSKAVSGQSVTTCTASPLTTVVSATNISTSTVNQPKVVTPSQAGLMVTQLASGNLALRPQGKMVTGAGLPAQFLVPSSINSSQTVTQQGGGQILMTSGGKPGQNIQVVRTMLGQQTGLKPGQTTLLISQPTLQQAGTNIVSTAQVVQNAVISQGKVGAKNKAPFYARVIPHAGLRLATVGATAGQSNPNVGMIQTVNKLLSTQNVSIATTHPGDGDHVIVTTTNESTETKS